MTILAPDYGRTLTEHERRIYQLEQRLTNPGVVHDNNFDDVVIGPPGNSVVISWISSPPTGLVLTPGTFYENVYVDVSWTAPLDGTAVEYEVECGRKTAPGVYELETVRRTIGTNLRFDGLDANVTYGFRVTGVNRIGVYSTQLPAAGMQEVTTGEDATIPNIPSNVAISAGFKTVTVSWDEPADRDVADGKGLFEVQLDIVNTFNSGGAGIPLYSKRVSGEITSFAGLVTGTTYYARVATIDSSGNQSAYAPTSPGYVSATTGSVANGDLGAAVVTSDKTDFAIGGGNMFRNSSFEWDSDANGLPDNWSAYGTPTSRSLDNTKEYHGTYSHKIVHTATTANEGVRHVGVNFIQGQVYTLSYWIYSDLATTARWTSSSGTGTISPGSGSASVTAGSWQRVKWTFTCTVGGTRDIYLYTSNANDVIYLDGAQLEIGDMATAYAPMPDEIGYQLVNTFQITDGAITTTKVVDGAITTPKLPDASITQSKVAFTVGGGNRVVNSSFEVDTNADGIPDSWAKTDSNSSITPTVSSTRAYHGTYSLKLVNTTTGEDDYISLASVPVVVGTTYVLSAWCYVESFTAGAVSNRGLYWAGSPNANTFINSSTPVGSWVRHSVRVVANTTSIVIRLYAPQGTVYWDAVQLEEGEVATSYAPKPDEILPNTITTTMVQDSAIGTTKIADTSITTGKIADSAITASKVNFTIGGGNMVKNSSFEYGVGVDTWTQTGSTGFSQARTAVAGAYRGAYVWRITESTAVAGTTRGVRSGSAVGTQFDTLLARPGEKWTISAWFRAVDAAAGEYLITLRFLNSGGATIGGDINSPSITFAASNTWYRNSVSGTAPAGTVAIDVIPKISASGIASRSYDIDAVQAEAGEVATAYAPKPDEITPGTITSTEIADDSITTPKLVAGAVVASKIAANTITAAQIAADTITANEIAASAITATELASGAVTTNKLAVLVGGGNMAPNSSFEDTTSTIWTASASTVTYSTTQARFGTNSIKVVATTTGSSSVLQSSASRFQAQAGSYVLSAYVFPETQVAGALYHVRVDLYDEADTLTTSPNSGSVACVTGQWNRISGIVTAPAGTAKARLWVRQTSVVAVNDTFYVDGVQMEAGDVLTAWAPKVDEILPGTIVASMIATDTITANELAAGAITASELAAGAVTAEKLTVGSLGTDQVRNGSFEEVSSTDATQPSDWQISTVTGMSAGTDYGISTAQKRGGAQSMFATRSASGDTARWLADAVPVVEDEIWHIAGWFYTEQTMTAGIYLRGVFTSTATTTSGTSVSMTNCDNVGATGGVWTKLEGQVVVPANLPYLRVQFIVHNTGNPASYPNTVYVDDISARRAVVSAIIQDGAIITDKLAANAVTASKIAANTITANEIGANAITASELAADAVTATKIAAGAVTAEKVTVTTFGANQCPNGSFEEVSSANPNIAAKWVSTTQAGSPTYTISTTQHIDGTQSVAMNCVATGDDAMYFSDYFPIEEGRTYAVETWVKGSAADADGVYLYLYEYDLNKGSAVANTLVSNTALTTSWALLQAQRTVAANKRWGRVALRWRFPSVAGTIAYFDGVALYSITDAVRIQDGTIVASKIAANTITAGQIAADAITSNKILAGAVVAGKIAANAVTSTEIAAGAVTATKISAGAITAENLTIGAFSNNLVPNGSFEEGSIADTNIPALWTTLVTSGAPTFTRSSSVNRAGDYAAAITCTSAQDGSWRSAWIPVNTGDTYFVEFWASASSATGTITAYIEEAIDLNGTTMASNQVATATASTSWTLFQAQRTVASGKVAARLRLRYATPSTTQTCYFDSVVLSKVTDAVRIGSGAVVAGKIASASISSDRIDTAGLDAAHIKFGTMSGDRITANTLDVASLKASTMSATEITLSGGISGGRLKAGNPLGGAGTSGMYIDSNGVRIYKDGSAVITLDAGTGSGTFKGSISSGSSINGATVTGTTITGGTIQTDTSGPRIVIDDVTNLIRFYSSSGSETVPGQLGTNGGTVRMRSGADASSGISQLTLFPGSTNLIACSAELSAGDVILITNTYAGGGTILLQSDTQTYVQGGNLVLGEGVDLKADSDSVTGNAPRIMCRGSSHIFSTEWISDSELAFYIDSTRLLSASTSGSNLNFFWGGSYYKTFVIPHPVEDDKYLVHATLEGPEAGVYYRGRARLFEGQAVVELPSYFEALTHQEDRSVMLTPVLSENERPTDLCASEVIDGQFVVEGVGVGEFWWEVKATRKDAPPLDVEPFKSSVDVHGDGPYTYVTDPYTKAKDKRQTQVSMDPRRLMDKVAEMERRIAELEGATR